MEAPMSEKIEKDPTAKKKLKLTKEVIEDLKDEDLDKVTGGGGETWAPGETGPRLDVNQNLD
jgi:hypothetical protein